MLNIYTYKDINRDLNKSLAYIHDPKLLKSKLIIANYSILMGKVSKVIESEEDPEFSDNLNRLFYIEEIIGLNLSNRLTTSKDDKEEIKSITSMMQQEIEILKSKIKRLKTGDLHLDDEIVIRERLKNHVSPQFIEYLIKRRNQVTGPTEIEIVKTRVKVKNG